MRYYKWEILKPKTTQWVMMDELSVENPRATHIHLENVLTTNKASSNSSLIVYNPSRELLSSSLIGYRMRITAGFKSQLPLAKSVQIGVVLDGYCFQQLPNTTTTTTTVNYILQATQMRIGAVELSFAKGITYAELVTNCCLKMSINPIEVDDALKAKKLDRPFLQKCETIDDLTAALSQYGIYRNRVGGVDFFTPNKNGGFSVPKSAPKTITWEDLIGQPVGQGISGKVSSDNSYKISDVLLPCHARGDIKVGDVIKMTVSNMTNNSAVISQNPSIGGSLNYAGQYTIISITNKLSSRDINAESWCTTLNGVTINGTK